MSYTGFRQGGKMPKHHAVQVAQAWSRWPHSKKGRLVTSNPLKFFVHDSEAWEPPQFGKKKGSRTEKAILGATFGIPGYFQSNSRNCTHDLSYVKTLFPEQLSERLSELVGRQQFSPKSQSFLFSKIGVVPARQNDATSSSQRCCCQITRLDMAERRQTSLQFKQIACQPICVSLRQVGSLGVGHTIWEENERTTTNVQYGFAVLFQFPFCIVSSI